MYQAKTQTHKARSVLSITVTIPSAIIVVEEEAKVALTPRCRRRRRRTTRHQGRPVLARHLPQQHGVHLLLLLISALGQGLQTEGVHPDGGSVVVGVHDGLGGAVEDFDELRRLGAHSHVQVALGALDVVVKVVAHRVDQADCPVGGVGRAVAG